MVAWGGALIRLLTGTACVVGLLTVVSVEDSALSGAAVKGGPPSLVAPAVNHGEALVAWKDHERGHVPGAELRPAQDTTSPNCTFNGIPGINEGAGELYDVRPGMDIAFDCEGFDAEGGGEGATVIEASPLLLSSNSTDETQTLGSFGSSNLYGSVTGTVQLPDQFAAPDPAALCPPTVDQLQDLGPCALIISDVGGDSDLIQLNYIQPSYLYTGMASTPDGGGYWLAQSNGAISTFGNATSYGSTANLTLNAPISHIVTTPDGKGYWLVAADGGTFAFGDAGFYGSMGGLPLNAPVVDIAPTADGKGYWLVASDGGIFAFGDAAFHGSMGGIPLNQPVVGIAPDFRTGGYWEVASDGGIFAFDAPFYGSTGALKLNEPVNGMAPTRDDLGYWFVASDGGIFAYGDATFSGSTGGQNLLAQIVGMTTDPANGGYWFLGALGTVYNFGGAPYLGSGVRPG